MISVKVLRKLAIPGSCGIVVYAKEAKGKAQQDKEECDDSRKLVKPSELPLYTEPPKPVVYKNEDKSSFLYSTVSCARQELMAVLQQGRVVRSEIEDGIYEVLKEGQDVIDYLREEDNLVPRVGAIALGGLAGYISGLRKGFIKRLFRTGLGAGLLAAVCYPREAREYSEEAFREAKKYLIVAYHFVNGDKIDYEQIEKRVKEEPLFFPEKKDKTTAHEPAKESGPVKPSDPAKQNEPMKPSDPVKQNEPAKPSDPTKQNEPAKQGEPVNQNEPAKPSDPAKQNEPTKQSDPTKQNDPTKQSDPTKPSIPEKQNQVPASENARADCPPPRRIKEEPPQSTLPESGSRKKAQKANTPPKKEQRKQAVKPKVVPTKTDKKAPMLGHHLYSDDTTGDD